MSPVYFAMISTRKQRKRNARLFSPLSESETNLMIRQNNHEPQTENRTNTVEEINTSNNSSNPPQVNDSQVEVQALEEVIVSKPRI